jgi:hypothetical protein
MTPWCIEARVINLEDENDIIRIMYIIFSVHAR